MVMRHKITNQANKEAKNNRDNNISIVFCFVYCFIIPIYEGSQLNHQ